MTHPDGARPPQIQVLLATYNGARFLGEQLDSLLAQTYSNFEVLVRDDKSSDDTLALLQSWQARHPGFLRMLADGGPNSGAKDNYLRLLQACDAPFVAFCDQDDIWSPNKLLHSMQAMLALQTKYGADTPLLVFTDLEIVDQQGKMLFASLWEQQGIDPRRTQLRHLLLQNTVTGCTALLNRALVERCAAMPPEAVMHDWWAALMASIYGHALGLEERTVRYRQHGANAVGAVLESANYSVPKWHDHNKRKEDWDGCVQQARGLLTSAGSDLDAAQTRTIKTLLRADSSASRRGRLAAFMAGGFRRTGIRSTLALLWFLWDKDAVRNGSSSRVRG